MATRRKGSTLRVAALEVVPYAAVAVFLWTIAPDGPAVVARRWPEVLTFPPGPLRLLAHLSGAGLAASIEAARLAHVLGLLLFVVPRRGPRVAGGLVAGVAAAYLAGVHAALGKIDHQLLVHALPALIAVDLMARSGTLFVRVGLAAYFAQAALAKAFGGWLPAGRLATRDWLLQYREQYASTTLGLELLAGSDPGPVVWKTLDAATIASEAAIALAFLVVPARGGFLVLALLATFHLAVAQLFGIAFVSLIVVYWWAVQPAGSARLWTALGVAIVAARLAGASGPSLQLVVLAGSLAAHAALRAGAALPTEVRPVVPTRAGRVALAAWLAVHLVTIPFGIAGREVFPAFGGPRFSLAPGAGTCPEVCRFRVRGGSASVRAALGHKIPQLLLAAERERGERAECPSHVFLPDDSARLLDAGRRLLAEEGIDARLERVRPLACPSAGSGRGSA